MQCASCSQPLPDGARFCPFCGQEVSAVFQEERKVVTVLFADVVGFTALSEHLDPERVKRLVDGAFSRLIVEIERFGGRVDKVLGDGILALFGAPSAHEDDPERAVRTAIEMHRALHDHVTGQTGAESVAEGLQLRVGVNTGEVVVGTVSGSDDVTAMGDVVNVASRLQAMAPAGGTYIGASTADQLSPSIERVLVADTTVRGRVQSERVWQVTGRIFSGDGPASRSALPFVGRATQRELFASIMGLVAGGRGAVVSVSGEAGSGKTRLVNEALIRFPHDGVAVISGACAPYGETNVWAPIANPLFKVMGADRDVETQVLRDAVHTRGLELFGFDDSDPRLHRFVEGTMHLFGHPSELDRVAPAQAREILMQVVVEGLHRRSQRGPVVVWVDDLQWADPLLIDLLARLARSLVDRPVLLVTAQRDDAEIDWPPATDHPILVQMKLEPLSLEESGELVDEIFVDGAPDGLVDQLFERSGGNPLFLIELAQVAHERPDGEQLPSSLRALIAARLDALGPSQRNVIDNAAVLGSEGSVGSLGKFASEMHQEYEPSDLDQLVADGLLEIDAGWWRFRSDVVREVAYRTLTKSSRAQRHAGTAHAMRAIGLTQGDQAAHHAASAAELVAEIGPVPGVPDDIAEQAVELLEDAARRSVDVGAFNQAIRHTSRAIELAPGAAAARGVRLLRAEAYAERREAPSAHADALAALDAAFEVGDEIHEGIARRILGVVAQQAGDLDEARRELSESVEILRRCGDRRELAISLSDRGFVEVFGGSLPDADRLLAEAESVADELGDPRQIAWIRQHQAWVAFLSGDAELAEERLAVALGLFDDLGDRSGISWANGMLAYVRFFERRFDEAERLADVVRQEALATGERWAPAMMDALVSSIRLWSGRFVEAEELSRRALAGFRELGDRFGIVQALAPRMRALVALGRTQEAERSLEESVALADSFGDLAFPTQAAAGTAAHLGLGERAVALAEVALERTEAMHANASEARVGLALAHCQVGDPEVALTTLLEVDDERPYTSCVRAIASGMLGDHDAAIAHADPVLADPSSTYLDRVMAGMAAGAALLARGDLEAARERLDAARATADRAGDEVARAVARCTAVTLLGEASGVEGVEQDDHLGSGWHRVIEGLTGAVPHAAPPRAGLGS